MKPDEVTPGVESWTPADHDWQRIHAERFGAKILAPRPAITAEPLTADDWDGE